MVADQCHRLALTLNSISRKTSFEDLQSSVTSLAQCTANMHSVRLLRNPSSQIDHLGDE
jgi:hypothetical protein